MGQSRVPLPPAMIIAYRAMRGSYAGDRYAPGMIARLAGTLDELHDGVALVRCGGLCYEVLVPAADQMRLAGAVGAEVEFVTLHYLEAQGQGSSFWPRLIGFRTVRDREFFELLTTVKGIGNRKALRALQLPFPQVAQAIVDRNLALLTSLPEIGRKTAETIVVDLKEKMGPFLEVAAPAGGAKGPVPTAAGQLALDAVAILVQLGESRAGARDLVDRALHAEPALATADAVVTAAFRFKSS
jgi:Holliday junction DNA helicase RuvA